jgi:hypothetical protein
MNIASYRKALVPVGVAVVLAVAARLGFNGDMSLKDIVTLIVTGGLVYFTPNKQ